MKNSIVSSVIIGVGFLAAICGTASAQTTIFNDQFTSGDTVQSASPANPTATSTAYEYFQGASAPVTPTGYTSGAMVLTGVSGSSEFSEVEAQFTSSPITLATVGDYVDYSIVFVNVNNIMPSSPSTLNVGMYNSGGSKPAEGVELNTSGEGTGGAVGWQGYVGRITGTGGSPEILTRTTQGAGPTNPNQEQDALFNDASSSTTFDSPKGPAVGSPGSVLASGLTAGSTYTVQLRYTLSAAGTITILNSLYSGSDTAETGTPLYILSVSTNSVAINGFDSLAFGWRFDTTAAANGVDLKQVLVTDDIQTVGAVSSPHIFGIGVSGTTLTFSATNGTANGQYTLLESANPALALSSWTPVFTNTFDGNGDINLSTNIVNPANPLEFYSIEQP